MYVCMYIHNFVFKEVIVAGTLADGQIMPEGKINIEAYVYMYTCRWEVRVIK